MRVGAVGGVCRVRGVRGVGGVGGVGRKKFSLYTCLQNILICIVY